MLLIFGDTTSLEFDVSESPRAEVSHISHLGNDNRARAREIETVHEDPVETPERDVLYSVIPNDFRYEVQDRGDNTGG